MIVGGDGGEWRSAKASDGQGRPKDPRSADDDDNADDDFDVDDDDDNTGDNVTADGYEWLSVWASISMAGVNQRNPSVGCHDPNHDFHHHRRHCHHHDHQHLPMGRVSLRRPGQ